MIFRARPGYPRKIETKRPPNPASLSLPAYPEAFSISEHLASCKLN